MNPLPEPLPGVIEPQPRPLPPPNEPAIVPPQLVRPAAETAIQLFPKWLVVVLGIVGFVLAVGLLIWSLMAPNRFDATFSRTILALFFAFVGGLFLFILYPYDYRLTRVPYVDLALELVGPAALFVGLVVFIRWILPTPADWQVYDLRTDEGVEIADLADFSKVTLTYTDGKDSRDYQLVLKPGTHVLEGIRIHYPENVSKRTARIHLSQFLKDQPLEFDRYGDRVMKIKLEAKP